MKAVVRATFEAMEFNRKEKTWMVNYIQNKWKLTPKVAEESYRVWLNGFTADGKIPLKDLQGNLRRGVCRQADPQCRARGQSHGLYLGR